MTLPFSVVIPLRAQGSQNIREHHMVRSRRVAKERDLAMLKTARLPESIRPALVVRLTRVGARTLDFDNLVSSLKAVRDGVARRLKVDDATPLVSWEYAQAKGEYAVRVEVLEAAGPLGIVQTPHPEFPPLSEEDLP